MNRKGLLAAAAVVVCLGAGFLYQAFQTPDGSTRESREELLNASLEKGEGWSIVQEKELEDRIISAASSSDGRSTIAVFEPEPGGGYRFSTSTNRYKEEIVIGGTVVDGTWYDLIWFGGAQTEYAEVRYTVGGERRDPLRYDTAGMEIIAVANPEQEYTIEVSYVDGKGNIYQ